MKFMVKIVSFVSLLFFSLHTTLAISEEITQGTKGEARDLLNRAVNLVEVNDVVAFTMMTIPNSGFQTKDLYPFCFNYEGILISHPYNLGVSISDFVSEDGVEIGKEMKKNASYGKVSEISYQLPVFENGILTKKKSKKTTLYTKVKNYICASGFYPN